MVTVVEEFRSRAGRVATNGRAAAPGIPAGTTNYIYYDSQWSRLAGISARAFWAEDGLQQLIETRTNGTANSDVTEQMVWSAAYINAPVLQDTYNAGVIQPNSRLYFTQDANWNTTAVIGYNTTTGTWQVAQRYVYSPYGNISILNPDFTTAPTGTQPLANNLYQGMSLDPVTGLYYERARWYSPALGTWTSQDPLSYINGANTYQFVVSNPVGSVDQWGTAHGNSLTDTRPQVIYQINGPDGNVYKYGISGTPPDTDGQYPRLQNQLNQLNEGMPEGQPGYTGNVIDTAPNRATAVDAEQALVDNYYAANGEMPGIMKRPLPSVDAIEAYQDAHPSAARGSPETEECPEDKVEDDIGPFEDFLEGIDPLGILLNVLTTPGVAGGSGDMIPVGAMFPEAMPPGVMPAVGPATPASGPAIPAVPWFMSPVQGLGSNWLTPELSGGNSPSSP